MDDRIKSVKESITDWIGSLAVGLRAALLVSEVPSGDPDHANRSIDPDFDGWLHGNPMVTMNPASRYGDDATGFLAGGELENPDIAARED